MTRFWMIAILLTGAGSGERDAMGQLVSSVDFQFNDLSCISEPSIVYYYVDIAVHVSGSNTLDAGFHFQAHRIKPMGLPTGPIIIDSWTAVAFGAASLPAFSIGHNYVTTIDVTAPTTGGTTVVFKLDGATVVTQTSAMNWATVSSWYCEIQHQATFLLGTTYRDVVHDNFSETWNGIPLHSDPFDGISGIWTITDSLPLLSVTSGKLQSAGNLAPPNRFGQYRHTHTVPTIPKQMSIARGGQAAASRGRASSAKLGNPYCQLFGCYVNSTNDVYLFRRNIAGEAFDETDTGINADEASIERKEDGTLILSAVANSVITNYQSQNQGATWAAV